MSNFAAFQFSQSLRTFSRASSPLPFQKKKTVKGNLVKGLGLGRSFSALQ